MHQKRQEERDWLLVNMDVNNAGLKEKNGYANVIWERKYIQHIFLDLKDTHSEY